MNKNQDKRYFIYFFILSELCECLRSSNFLVEISGKLITELLLYVRLYVRLQLRPLIVDFPVEKIVKEIFKSLKEQYKRDSSLSYKNGEHRFTKP